MVKTLNSLTSGQYDTDACLKVGKRIINLFRMFNKREGMTKDADSFSSRLGQAPVDGPRKGQSIVPTYERMRDAYYREMGWDENGMPTKETLESLNLGFTIASRLE